MKKFLIAPSILSSNLAHLGNEIKKIINAGADIIHLDVMDNHYVNNLTFGPIICKAIKKYCYNIPISVHLMAKPKDKLILDFIKFGANYIIIHVESCNHIYHKLKLIKKNNCKAGLAFNPTTPLNNLQYIMNEIDTILIMSVNPGEVGQKFIPIILKKIIQTKKIIKNSKCNINLEIDGGVNINNIIKIAKAGANTFVIGSGIFNQKKSYKKTIKKIKKKLNKLILN